MSYHTIFIDVDGTLLTNTHHLTEENITAIQRALTHGIDIILCSGRTPVSLYTVAKKMQYTPNYLIGFNGGTVIDTDGNHLFKNTMPQAHAIEIIKYIESYSICVGVYIESNTIVIRNAPNDLNSIMDKNIIRIDVPESEQVHDKVDRPIMKIMAVGDHKQLQKIYDYYVDNINDRFVMVFTHGHILEFIPKNVNKGVGVAWLCDHLGIDIQKTVAIGDNYNDLEMIDICGLGATPSNGVEAAKAIANYIAKNDNNHSAVAEVIEHVLQLNENL